MHFIISAPRSGSTWLARALSGHPEIFATENRLFGNFCEIWPDAQGKASPRITLDSYAQAMAMNYLFAELGWNRKQFVDHYISDYISFIEDFSKRHSGKPVIVDKITPYNGTTQLLIKQIRRYCPDSKVVHLIRDGRDVATSGVFDWVARSDPQSDRYRYFVQRTPGMRLERLFDDQALQQWCAQWNDTLDLGPLAAGTLTVRYEQMIEDQSDVLRRMFEFFGVDSDRELAERCAARVTFEKTTGRAPGDETPLAKARKGIAGDWQNYFTRLDGELFQQLSGHWLAALGYEQDSSWVASLPERLDLQIAET